MSVGDVLSGVVTSMEDYGAFVAVRELPGDVVGLIYKNELSWEKIMTVDEVLQKGGAGERVAACMCASVWAGWGGGTKLPYGSVACWAGQMCGRRRDAVGGVGRARGKATAPCLCC